MVKNRLLGSISDLTLLITVIWKLDSFRLQTTQYLWYYKREVHASSFCMQSNTFLKYKKIPSVNSMFSLFWRISVIPRMNFHNIQIAALWLHCEYLESLLFFCQRMKSKLSLAELICRRIDGFLFDTRNFTNHGKKGYQHEVHNTCGSAKPTADPANKSALSTPFAIFSHIHLHRILCSASLKKFLIQYTCDARELS